MGLLSNEIDRNSSLQAGDHVYCFRNGHIYSHHGIYVGENRVIHFTRTQEPEPSKSSHITRCKECKYAPEDDLGVVKCCLDCFLKGHRLFRFEYCVSSSRLVFNRSGTCTTGPCRYSPEEVVRRATEMLNSVEGFGEYELLRNNCETFAVYCKTSMRMSLQAYSWKNRAKTFYRDLTSQPFSVKSTAKTMFKLGVTYKFDTLRHDREVHQHDHDDHHHHQEEEKDDDEEEEEDDDEQPR